MAFIANATASIIVSIPILDCQDLELQIVTDSLHSLNGFFPIAKGCKAEISLATWAKASARSTDNMYIMKELVKKIPGRHIIRSLEPDIWCINTAKGLDTNSL